MKVKKQNEKIRDIGYEEWLLKFGTDVSERDIESMEKEHLSKQPINNPNYSNFKTGA